MLKSEILSDNDLFASLKLGDESAFAQIYERYWEVLFRHALRMLPDEEENKDVLQEVFITLWNTAPDLNLKTTLSAYLYTLVRNRILNVIARNKIKSSYLDSLENFLSDGVSTADHLIRENQLALLIEEEVALLPPKMRTIFELSRKENLSYQEISSQLHVTDHTVKKQISNALKQLRYKLGISSILIVLFILI